MRKTEKIYPGDKIITKKTYRPLLPNDERFNPEGEVYIGVVIDKRGSFLLVDFQNELPFTHYIGNMLDKPTGCAVQYKDVKILETFESDDDEEREFVGLMKGLKFNELQKIPKEIRFQENKIEDNIMRVKNILRDVSQNERNIEKMEFELKKLKSKKRNATVDTDKISKQYRAMMKNKKIKKIEILEENGCQDILLTTNDLTYKNQNSSMPDYVLGAYKILIPLEEGNSISAINYKKHVKKFEYHHPCIKRSQICLGQAMINEVKKLRETNNIVNLSHLLINFLEEPNYNGPHISEDLFYCSQDVTIKPKSEYDWFSSRFWDENEQWDGDKYTEDEKKIRRLLEGYCPDCWDSSLEDFVCNNCGYEF